MAMTTTEGLTTDGMRRGAAASISLDPDNAVSIESLSPEAEVALLARALYRIGYDDYELGHITYRLDHDTYLTNPRQLGWNEIRASDVVRIDGEGNVLEGRWVPRPGVRLHLEFHRARPGCKVTLHQHPRYATAWSALGELPPVYDQRGAGVFDDEFVFYDDYTGGVAELEAARAAVAGIGEANFALLRNHGVFIVADDIRQAHQRASALEWRCMMASRVQSVGKGHPMPDRGRETIVATMRRMGGVIPGMWEWAIRVELRADPSVLD